ncbi:MAG TPA: phage tail tape measure protein [Candidatus Desulfovibrio intestinavium]|uniref:Phage tail tape measure protein n=1 Tax=Candidatus Desulfovibrio intestinavium TaxID=2838534 RepID=A0A9D2HPI6_9BACT|nr:phage tail tape measure protein [Candidatus Desulfovibrio intestinavium]
MEVFSVFATFSLVDLISGPLGRIQAAMKKVDASTATLSEKCGIVAASMGKLALGAGALLGAFGLASTQAIAFESAMADVAKVVNFDSQAEMEAMSDTIRDMAGRIPMAADGIAAIIAAAGQSGVAREDLTEFAEQAAKMGVAFDLTGDQAGKMMADWRAGMALSLPQVYSLADAVNHLSNNMNATAPALGEVIQRVGAAAMACGLGETQVAALGAAFLSAGASPEIASTALKKFTTTLVRGAAMSDTQAEAFRNLGFSATQMAKDMQSDAQGTIFKVLQALANKPKELQMSLLTQMFGEEAIGAIAPLLQNMGNLTQAFELVGDAANYAGSMQAEFDVRSKTTENALILLRNKLVNLGISVGNVFLPAIAWGADALGTLADGLRALVETPFGQWVVGAAAALAAGVVAVTAFSGAMWGLSRVGPIVSGALAPLKTILLGLGWPVWAVIAAVAALYLAYKTNFGGMADTLNRWWKNISLVVRGVLAAFRSMSDGIGTIRGELATDIKAAGLAGVVTTVARVVYRIREFFAGLWDTLDFSPFIDAFAPVGRALSNILAVIGNLFSHVFGGEVTSSADSARNLGSAIGGFLNGTLQLLAWLLGIVAQGVENVSNLIGFFVSLLTGDVGSASEYLRAMFEGIGEGLARLGDLFGVGDSIREAWAEVMAFFDGINLFESGAKLLSTLIEGIKSMASSVVNSVADVFAKVREYLPFSDAHVGPLSQLTLSGSRIPGTLGEGVTQGMPSLRQAVSAGLGGVGEAISSWWDSLWTPAVPDPVAAPPDRAEPASGRATAREAGQTTITITIHELSLPGVTDKDSFVASLQGLVAEMGA